MWSKLDGKQKRILQNSAIALVVVVSCAMVSLACSIYADLHPKKTPVPTVVTKFLDEFLSDEYQSYEAIYMFPRYFYDLKDEMPPADATLMEYYSVEQDLFEQVFYRFQDKYSGYIVEQISCSYVKVTPLLEDGSADMPPVGLWYTTKGGFIDTWRIARLSPFSVYDAEYSEVWDEL